MDEFRTHSLIQKTEENKCLSGMSNSSTAENEKTKENEREILVCDLHPQHVQKHTYNTCFLVI